MNIPAPHFLLFLVKEFKHTWFLLILQYTRQIVDNIFVFLMVALELKFMVSALLQIQAGFLHTFTSHLPKLALANTMGNAHRESATEWEYVWVRHTEHWGCPWVSWEIHVWGILSSSRKGFLMESTMGLYLLRVLSALLLGCSCAPH